METGAGAGAGDGNSGRGIPKQPQELNLRPEWQRQRPRASPSEPSTRGAEEDLLLLPEWRRSKPSASASANANASVWEPEWRRSRPSSTAFPWNQNYCVRRQGASSTVERGRNPNDLWRQAPAADSVAPTLEKLQISKELAASFCTFEKKDRISPIRRPDNGGTLAILTSRLHVNHFPVTFNPESVIMHYSVSVNLYVSFLRYFRASRVFSWSILLYVCILCICILSSVFLFLFSFLNPQNMCI